MRATLKNVVVFIVAFVATHECARVLIDISPPWQTSDSPLHVQSFFGQLLLGFVVVSFAYIVGGLIVQWLFSGPRPLAWCWGLCLVALLFQPIPWGGASITDVSLLAEAAFLASVYFPPLTLGITATLFTFWRSSHGKQAIALSTRA